MALYAGAWTRGSMPSASAAISIAAERLAGADRPQCVRPAGTVRRRGIGVPDRAATAGRRSLPRPGVGVAGQGRRAGTAGDSRPGDGASRGGAGQRTGSHARSTWSRWTAAPGRAAPTRRSRGSWQALGIDAAVAVAGQPRNTCGPRSTRRPASGRSTRSTPQPVALAGEPLRPQRVHEEAGHRVRWTSTRRRSSRTASSSDEVIGRFDHPLLPPNPRTRKSYDEEKWTGYEVVLDVFPDVIAYGILLLPKDLKPGEKRPVVVCQHGWKAGRRTLSRADHPAYHDFAAKLAERGLHHLRAAEPLHLSGPLPHAAAQGQPA